MANKMVSMIAVCLCCFLVAMLVVGQENKRKKLCTFDQTSKSCIDVIPLKENNLAATKAKGLCEQKSGECKKLPGKEFFCFCATVYEI